ncbi:putative transcription initiation factor IIA subunit 1 [Apostichopus japonicus]|uniref:Putative transcription initiation factor IIA subunit 1 n=1 Tax=Stichopus japonicus TaxID=307972 RepID=A0A2G8KVU2_STIJA|nr:putative transcription initiation factor IIA subunit 1 [Apostichopus japonicus]
MTTPQAVYKLYKSVIDDVVNNVREAFIDEGVDEQVLQDLKQMWENKLLQTDAVDPNAAESHQHQSSQKSSAESRSDHSSSSSSNKASHSTHHHSHQEPAPKLPLYDKKFQSVPTQPSQYSGTLSSPATAATLALQQQVQQQVLQIQGAATTLTLPQGGQSFQVQGIQGGTVRYQVPLVIQHLNQGNQQIGQQIMASIPQQGGSRQPVPISIAETRQAMQDPTRKILQLDGTNDTSDEDDDSDDAEENNEEDGDDDDDDQDENEKDEYSNAVEEEPLNSDDDVSDEDPQELFEAENVVVCQYDKISRTRNKWKFQLKQGIMNLKGKDNIFFRAIGEADW